MDRLRGAREKSSAELLEQGLEGGAGYGVRRAELPGSGSRSAVFLIHTEVSGGAGRTKNGGISAGRFVKNRMLSHAEYERPVTRGTRTEAREFGVDCEAEAKFVPSLVHRVATN